MDTCPHCGQVVRRPGYCCIGCGIVAQAIGAGAPDIEARRYRSLILRVGLAAFFTSNVMVLSLFLYSMTDAPAGALALIRALLIALSVPVFALLAPPYLRGLGRDVRRARFSMDSLVAIGATAALGFSIRAALAGTGREYFDTATGVLLLVTVGRLIESNARVRGRRSVRELIELQPKTAVAPGERVRVLAGERVPVDGRIVNGGASLDESMLTGEALPAERVEGDTVRAGTLCMDGAIEIEASGGEPLISRIITSVEEAQQRQSPLERIADRAASVFVPLTSALAAATAVYWWWRAGAETAVMNALSVLVVACPCALALAAPLVNVIAIGAAARRGVLVRSAEGLERLARVQTLVLDKTGTVTSGHARVTAASNETLAWAAAAASQSAHPVARAVLREAEERGIEPEEPRRVRVFPGRGVEAELTGGQRVMMGEARWVGAPQPGTWCSVDGRVVGRIDLEDPVSEEAVHAAAELRGMRLELALYSGDREDAVRAAAGRLGIGEFAGGLLPEDKAARVASLPRAAMAGDGINDAPALAAAEVGIAVAGGTDVAREVAQVVVLEGGLRRIPWVIALARRARSVAIQNAAWTLGYNTVALALAASGRLRPAIAALLMLASSVIVIANAARVRRTRVC